MTEAAAELCRALIASKGNPPIIGGVALHRVVGSGSIGVVYHGTHLRLRIPVAVKFLVLGREDSDRVSRFVGKAGLAARINCPNLVRVYDVNKDAGVEYIVEEFVNGQTAEQRLRDALSTQQKLTEDFVLELAADVARGLAAIHDLGYLHLDIKPENIMVSRKDSICKILDFGLALPINDAQKPGSLLAESYAGTPGYASPEQLQREECGQSSDIYCLGATLFELLTGQKAFPEAGSWEKAKIIQNTRIPPDVRTLRPEISELTAGLVEKCLRLNPLKRFTSARSLLAEIARFKQQRMTQVRPSVAARGTTMIAVPVRKDQIPFVVCVDDNAQICMLMSELLEEAGFRAETYTDGARALAKMRQSPPDVVLLDMEMPGMSGSEICAAIRLDPLLKSIPVVFITGETSTESMSKAIHEGATDYLFKPVQADELISRVHCLTHLSRTQQELSRLENQFKQFCIRPSAIPGN